MLYHIKVTWEKRGNFEGACLAGLSDILERKKPSKINYVFSARDEGNPGRWENWIAGIKKWWFFDQFIGDPKKIAEEGKIEFDLTKMTSFEFYSVFSCVRLMYEVPPLHSFVFDLNGNTGEQLLFEVSNWSRGGEDTYAFFGEHSLFTRNFLPAFTGLHKLPPNSLPISENNYEILDWRIKNKEYYKSDNTY